jgi:hypothetical protein
MSNNPEDSLEGALLLEKRRQFFSDYRVVQSFDFESCERTLLDDEATLRTCRYCRRSIPDVRFKSEAHAVPHFLGNTKVFTKNECDTCNSFLGREYEDHLAKWSHLFRAAVGIVGKNGVPVFKSKDIRLETSSNGLSIAYQNPDFSPSDVDLRNFSTHKLLGDNPSQSYVPFRAAMALIRIACSLCPQSSLNTISLTLDWMLDIDRASIPAWHVMFACTPGPLTSKDSRVLLLQRKSQAATPFLILVIRFRNIRLQTFVPFCASDDHWIRRDQPVSITIPAFPSRFDEHWPYGKSNYGTLDWSSKEPRVDRAGVEFIFLNLRGTDGIENTN